MSASEEEFSQFVISVDDIDKSLLPEHARTPGTDAFREEVSKLFQRDFAEFGGWAKIIVGDKTVDVSWRSDPHGPDPFQIATGKLKQGKYADGIRLLELLRIQNPEDVDVLINLGMALSDIQQFPMAEAHLRHALDIDPNHVGVLIALGVALARQQRDAEAIDVLRSAVNLGGTNPWAHRNLGACLLRQGQIAEAEQCFRNAVDLNPKDQQAVFGLAQVLVGAGKLVEADKLYREVIEIDGRTDVAEVARQQLTKLASQAFRKAMPDGVRPDAVMYCLDALQKIEGRPRSEIQRIGFEIAVLGQRGLDPNNPTKQHELKSLAGTYSGLHLLCIMYAAFKVIAPNESIGFDVSKEYELAKVMHGANEQQG